MNRCGRPLRLVWAVAGICAAVALLQACSGPAPSSETTPAPAPGDRIYHVQLRLTENKAEALETQGRAQQWWEQQPAEDRPPLLPNTAASARPVTIAWKAPFYRVRLGPFASEARADSVLAAAQPTFPDAFVAPDRVQASAAQQ